MISKSFMTKLTHLGERNPPSVSMSKSLPISLSSVFTFDDVDDIISEFDRALKKI